MDEDVSSFHQQVRRHLRGSGAFHVIPENTKMLVIDSQVPFSVALRSLFDYRRPFACVFHSPKGMFRQLFDGGVIIEVLLCIWLIETSGVFRKKLFDALKATPDTQLSSLVVPENFSAAPLLDEAASAQKDDSPLPMTGGEKPTFSNGGLWLATLATWHDLLGGAPYFPFMSCRRDLLEVSELLILANLHLLPLWDEENCSPISFTSPIAVLSHVMQTLRGSDAGILDLPYNQSMHCAAGDDVVVLPMSTPLIDVLFLLRRTGWSAVPLVDAAHRFEMCFSRHNFLQGFSAVLSDQATVDFNEPVETFVRLWMPDSPRRGRVYSFRSPDGVRRECPACTSEASEESTARVSVNSAAHHVSSLLSSIVCGAASSDTDMTFREAITHLALSEDHRVVIVDQNTRRVMALITPSDALAGLAGLGRLRMADTSRIPAVSTQRVADFLT